jgi:hypothetical protein
VVVILATEVDVSKIQPLEIEPQTKLVEEEVQIVELKVDTEPLVVVLVKTTKIIVEETYA